MLKSQMAVPSLTKSIETMRDIYESGLPVEMIDFGDIGTLAMKRSSDPIIKHIYENRVPKEFSPIVQVVLVIQMKFYTSTVLFSSYKMLTLGRPLFLIGKLVLTLSLK